MYMHVVKLLTISWFNLKMESVLHLLESMLHLLESMLHLLVNKI